LLRRVARVDRSEDDEVVTGHFLPLVAVSPAPQARGPTA
jgi:hypothetical protein